MVNKTGIKVDWSISVSHIFTVAAFIAMMFVNSSVATSDIEINKQDIKANCEKIEKVKKEIKEDMKELKNDMNHGFDRINDKLDEIYKEKVRK